MLTGFSGNMSINPRGLVIYPDNNTKWRGWAYYRKGEASQSGEKTKNLSVCSGSHSDLRKYTVTKHDDSKITVAAAKTLDKKAKKNLAYDPTTFNEIGYLNWEPLRKADGTLKPKPDSTGEFEVIAKKMRSLYNLPSSLLVPFANVHDDLTPGGTESDTRDNFFEALADVKENALDFFAYAGHGGSQSLPSAQVRNSDKNRLADEIRRLLRPDGIVIFYACSTGAPAGFASQLSTLLPAMRVWGHPDSGQASRNADKVCFRNGVGTDIRTVLSAAARSKWAEYLLHSPDLYARFPFMAIETIEAELTA